VEALLTIPFLLEEGGREEQLTLVLVKMLSNSFVLPGFQGGYRRELLRAQIHKRLGYQAVKLWFQLRC
jgi:hypothetical protein